MSEDYRQTLPLKAAGRARSSSRAAEVGQLFHLSTSMPAPLVPVLRICRKGFAGVDLHCLHHAMAVFKTLDSG
jgi:hypothetical protein